MLHFIPFVNNYSLLEKAYNSCRTFTGSVIILDNRDIITDERNPIELGISENHSIIKMPVPLSTAQMMNYILFFAHSAGESHFTWQHSDAYYSPECLTKLWFNVESIEDKNWGVIHTHYDILCAYNTQALMSIGGWDYIRFPWYFLDNDIHIRLEKAGYQLYIANVGEIIHEPSTTINTNTTRKRVNSLLFPICETLFNEKHPDKNNYGKYKGL